MRCSLSMCKILITVSRGRLKMQSSSSRTWIVLHGDYGTERDIFVQSLPGKIDHGSSVKPTFLITMIHWINIYALSSFAKRHFVLSSCPVGQWEKENSTRYHVFEAETVCSNRQFERNISLNVNGITAAQTPVPSPPHVLVHEIVDIRLINSVNRFVDLELEFF